MEALFPDYLRRYMRDIKLTEYKSKGQVVCSCGCDEFDYNYLHFTFVCPEDTKKMIEINKRTDEMRKNHTGRYERFKQGEKIPLEGWTLKTFNGVDYWIYHFDKYGWMDNCHTIEEVMERPDYIAHVEKVERDPNKPAEYEYIYAKCKRCGKEILLFDDRYYGYDGVCTHSDQPNKPYLTNGKLKTRKTHCEGSGYKIYVTIDSTGKDDLLEDSDGVITEENWKDAFEWIKIDIECAKCGKKRNVLNLETM